MYPKILQKVIEDFQKLPGIGEKTAERLALFLVSTSQEDDLIAFSDHLKKIKTDIKECTICHMLSYEETCVICKDSLRDQETIMVVSDIKDVVMVEKTKTYHGLYHVLGGLIDFSRGITHEQLHLEGLTRRLSKTKELIIATNGTVEGEMTAKFLKHYYHDQPILITRLAYGLPVGADLKYADELTLSKAVENRLKF